MGLFTSLHGHRLGLTIFGNLAAKAGALNITQPAVDAAITIGTENTNVRTVNVTLKDAKGNAINYVETFEIIVFSSAAMTALSAGGSTGLAIGTNGLLNAISAKKHFLATCEADGTWDGTWTDTGTDAFCIGVRLPNGRVVASAASANT